MFCYQNGNGVTRGFAQYRSILVWYTGWIDVARAGQPGSYAPVNEPYIHPFDLDPWYLRIVS